MNKNRGNESSHSPYVDSDDDSLWRSERLKLPQDAQ